MNAHILEKRENSRYYILGFSLSFTINSLISSKAKLVRRFGFFSNLPRNTSALPALPERDLQFQIKISFPITPTQPPNINFRLPVSYNNLASSHKVLLFPARLQIFGSYPHSTKSSTFFFSVNITEKSLNYQYLVNSQMAKLYKLLCKEQNRVPILNHTNYCFKRIYLLERNGEISLHLSGNLICFSF